MVSALTGDVSHPFAVVEKALQVADLRGTQLEAAAQFVGVVAAMRDGDYVRTADLADACVTTARVVDEPGWEASALALRIVAQPADTYDERTLDDLVRAEAALQRCTDECLTWSAHITLGLAYQSQRLFELAIIHQQAALEGPDEPFGVRASRLLPLLHLGETHLHWADELEQIGDSRHAHAVQEHRWLAAELAREAAEVGEADGADPAFLNEARMLELCASWEDDPNEAADELGASVEGAVSAGFTDHVQDHRARLAQIYAAKGQTDR
ncbi:MAG: hypothetical protein ACRDO8_08395, partial [Nocardioidaceae bacterium]